jgi:hypothetical protein
MTSTVLGFGEMKRAISDGRLTITTGKDIVKGTTPNNNVHHAYALKRQDGTSTESFNFTFPPLLVSHITKQIPGDSKFASYFVHGDIYGKWPLGKNRGEDLKGDELFDFFLELERVYHECLKADAETKNTIFLHTDQEPMGRDGRRTQVTDIMALINPIVQYPVFRDGHPQAKERDESKSPTFKIKLWDAKISEKNRNQIRKDSLLVNVDPMADPYGDPNDPGRYLQMIYTKIYDLRQQRDAMSDTYITKESVLDKFVYSAGDSTKGKSQCTLLATMTVLAPSWYWEAKKGASIQFKATTMEIFKQTVLRRANVRTPEIKVSRYQEAMAAIAEYGLDQMDEENDNGDNNNNNNNNEENDVPPQQQQNSWGNFDRSGSEQQYGTSKNQNNGGPRQINSSAVIAVRHKTNSVCVYPSKTLNGDSGSPAVVGVTNVSNSVANNADGQNNDSVPSKFRSLHNRADSPQRFVLGGEEEQFKSGEENYKYPSDNETRQQRGGFSNADAEEGNSQGPLDGQYEGYDQEGDEEITDRTMGTTRKRGGHHHNHHGGSSNATKKQRTTKK